MPRGTIARASRSMVSKTTIGLSVMRWVLPRPGIKGGQQDKIRCCGPHPLERGVEVEYSDGRVAQEALRLVVVHSSPLAQQQTQAYAGAQEKEAEALANHVRQVHARWFACLPEAEAAIAE